MNIKGLKLFVITVEYEKESTSKNLSSSIIQGLEEAVSNNKIQESFRIVADHVQSARAWIAVRRGNNSQGRKNVSIINAEEFPLDGFVQSEDLMGILGT